MAYFYKYRLLWLALVLVIGIFLIPGFKQALKVDNSLTAWFVPSDPALQSYQQFQKYFGNDEILILAIKPHDSLFSIAVLKKIKALSDSLEKLPDVAQIISPATATLPSKGLLATTSTPLLGKNLNMLKLRQTLAENSFIAHQVFSKNLKASKFVIRFKTLNNFEEKRAKILDKVKTVTRHFFNDDETFYGGVGVIFNALNQLSKQDFGRFLGLGYLLMFLLIAIIYRSWAYVLYALLTIGFATFFTLGVYGSFGYQLNLMTTLVPAIIILLCVMDVMHILNERTKQNQAIKSLTSVWKPCLFTTLTTMGGFLTLVVSPIQILKIFGGFSALGIAFGLCFAYLFGVLILPKVAHRSNTKNAALGLQRWQQHVVTNKGYWLTACGAVLIVAAVGVSKIAIDTNTLKYLPKNHPVQKDHQKLENIIGAYLPLEYLVFTDEAKGLKSPAVLKAMHSFAEKAISLPGFESATGYHQFYTAALKNRYGHNWQNHWDKTGFLEQVGQKIELIYLQLLRNFTTADYKVGRLFINGKAISAQQLEQNISRLDSAANHSFGHLTRVKVSGYQGLYANIINYVTQSQVNSFALAIVLIFGLLWLFLRDLKLAFISLLPNFFPVLFMLGFMGWVGINLDTATACIASIVLSFSIDDTLHFVHHFKRQLLKGEHPLKAQKETMGHVGRAIVLTSLVLFTGYILMVFGSLKTVVYFGLLTAVSIAAALFSQLVLFPILLSWAYRKK